VANQAEWFRAFVERSLQQVWDSPEIVRDADGDYPFGQKDGPTAYVTVEEEYGLGVCVWSYAAYGVKGTVRALREVNELNMGSRLCKVMWRNKAIRVELRLPADQVSATSLERACGHVKAIASDIGQVFTVVHGGERVLADPQAS
jgi:hypothetical protein